MLALSLNKEGFILDGYHVNMLKFPLKPSNEGKGRASQRQEREKDVGVEVKAEVEEEAEVSTKSLPAPTNSTCFIFLLLNTATLKVVVQGCSGAFTPGLSMMIQTIRLQEMLTSCPLSGSRVCSQ